MKTDNLNKKALKAGLFYTIGNILLKGCIFFTLPIFTRLLSTSDFGIYNTYIAYEGLITAVIGLGLYGTVKNAKLDFKDKFNKYLSSILTFSLIVLLLFLVLGNLLYPFIESFLGFNRIITNCMILQSFGSFLLFFYGAKLNIEFKYKSYIAVSFFNTVFNIIISIVLIKYVFINERYLGRILGSAIPLIFLAVLLTILILVQGKEFFNKKYWKYGLKIGLPLVPHVVSQSLLSQFDRIMIKNMTNESDAGIYSYIYTMCTITYVICQSLDNSWTPWVYMKLRDNRGEEIKKTGTKYVFLFSLLTIGFICVMPEIAKIIASESYWEGMDLIVPLALANYYVFMYMIPVGIEYYNKKTSFISAGTVGAAIINLILNIIAINFWGYKAAAYTTMISYILLYYFHRLIATKYNIKDYYNFKHISILNVVTIIVSSFILITYRFSLINLIIRYSIVAIVVLVMLLKKDDIIRIIKRGKNDEETIKNNS